MEEELREGYNQSMIVNGKVFRAENFTLVYESDVNFGYGKRIYKSNDFIGHIGGDDFMAVVEQEEADALCQFILDDFTKLLPDFYTQADLIKGFITTKNRHGIEEDFPLLSIAIAGVLNQNFQTVYQLAESASKIKKLCKQSGGNHYLLCLE